MHHFENVIEDSAVVLSTKTVAGVTSIIVSAFAGVLLLSCHPSKRYYAYNMFGNDSVEVTSKIERGYRPIYCSDSALYAMCAVERNDFPALSRASVDRIAEMLRHLEQNTGGAVLPADTGDNRMLVNYTYFYSYYISYDLIDVYKISTVSLDPPQLHYIRSNNTGDIIDSLASDHWVHF